MGKRRCSLCGGKLVNNKCVECGLDNSKNDSSYRPNENRCDHLPLTHVHDEPVVKPKAKKEPQKESRKNVQKTAHVSSDQQVEKAKKQFMVVILVIAVSLIIFGVINRIVNMRSTGDYPWLTDDVEYEYDPYKYLETELPETGEVFQKEYEAGEYIVGVHIPEGQYQVKRLLGYGNVSIEDAANSIYYTEYLSDDAAAGIPVIEDFRLFAGAKVQIDSGVRVQLLSENAQTESQSEMANPLTEKVLVTGTKTAGVDFPAGIYDVSLEQAGEDDYGMGQFDYIVPGTLSEEDIEEYGFVTGSVWFDEPGYCYCNVVLPEGTVVKAGEGKIILTPSEWIASEDYEGYYSNRYID